MVDLIRHGNRLDQHSTHDKGVVRKGEVEEDLRRGRPTLLDNLVAGRYDLALSMSQKNASPP
jgi:hypothetical protein